VALVGSQKPLPEQFTFDAAEFIRRELRALVSALETRFRSNEARTLTFDEEVERFQELGLTRINETITPLVAAALDRFEDVTTLFTARATGEHAVGLGAKEFVIPGEDRLSFIPTLYVSLRAVGSDPIATMAGTVLGFDQDTGELTVEITQSAGAGTYLEWDVAVSPPPALAGVSHGELDSAIDAAEVAILASAAGLVNALRTELKGGTIAAALDTIAELATAVGRGDLHDWVVNQLNNRAPINNPIFTGVPKAPTAGALVNDDQIATTAMVQAGMLAFSTRAPFSHGDIPASGTLAINPALGPVQIARKMGAMTISAPSSHGFVMLFLLNGSGSGGAPSFSGFEKVISGGDAFDSSVNARHLIQIQSVVDAGAGGWNWQSYQIKKLT
jgi:hypothetical protein